VCGICAGRASRRPRPCPRGGGSPCPGGCPGWPAYGPGPPGGRSRPRSGTAGTRWPSCAR
jgi:hypothetical protein